MLPSRVLPVPSLYYRCSTPLPQPTGAFRARVAVTTPRRRRNAPIYRRKGLNRPRTAMLATRAHTHYQFIQLQFLLSLAPCRDRHVASVCHTTTAINQSAAAAPSAATEGQEHRHLAIPVRDHAPVSSNGANAEPTPPRLPIENVTVSTSDTVAPLLVVKWKLTVSPEPKSRPYTIMT